MSQKRFKEIIYNPKNANFDGPNIGSKKGYLSYFNVRFLFKELLETNISLFKK